ncbi:hypothetical protein FB45DRAFT_914707 [Roridomyces roridus]|uniref:MYND-type domain-containing protein n=1 Tax=Roridomyces roridus TaxID=1738132 RepID=A0AAD7FR62_9AGAR|nr:hypothetical protein FB45DRAFT_914707 [Roridomyces roridus]
MKSCDNISCNKLAAKTDFMRCSACKKSYYCSRDCQATDWNDGGHREACEESTETLLCDERMSSTTREQSFIRMIFRDTIKCLREHPGAGYFVEFNYVTTPVEINVCSLSTDSKTLKQLSQHPQWQHILARTAHSEGPTTLHVVQMVAGETAGCVPIPLRSSSGMVTKELERIARDSEAGSGRQGEAELERMIQNLVLRSSHEVEDIH